MILCSPVPGLRRAWATTLSEFNLRHCLYLNVNQLFIEHTVVVCSWLPFYLIWLNYCCPHRPTNLKRFSSSENDLIMSFSCYSSFCPNHRPIQKISFSAKKTSGSTPSNVCSICLLDVDTKSSFSVLFSPCCKNSFHRNCIQVCENPS